jgi:hypothetical protein
MRLDPVKRIALMTLAAAAIAACDATGTTTPPPGPSPLGAGTWYLNTVDDSALGSTIATRIVGVTEERTFADSGFLVVNVDGSYEQRYWLRVFVTGVLDRSETVIDLGNWIATDTGYVFVSSVRSRSFLIVPIDLANTASEEQMVFYQTAPTTFGLYRRTRP